jgi:hypothetical protein
MLRWLCWSGTAEADGLFVRQLRFLATFTHFWIEFLDRIIELPILREPFCARLQGFAKMQDTCFRASERFASASMTAFK